MIELSAVTKRYGDAFALGPIDLVVKPRQTTVLIGPSGCGKSTLLRMMIGLVCPDTGSVSILSTELGPDNVLHLRRRMGYVIQEGGLFEHLTARDNVALMARFLQWDDQRIARRLTELGELVHLDARMLDRFPGELSGGQRQRVSLMRALMLDPTVLLLDEPLGALDPMIRARLQRELIDVFAALNKTVVMVTHDLAEAAAFSGDIVLMGNGRIAQRGDMRRLVEQPAEPFVTDFVSAQRPPAELVLPTGNTQP